MYLGCIPIVGTSALDRLYKDFPVLVVHDWTTLTEKRLQAEYEKLRPLLQTDISAMHREFWRRTVEADRTEFLGASNTSRFRCWG